MHFNWDEEWILTQSQSPILVQVTDLEAHVSEVRGDIQGPVKKAGILLNHSKGNYSACSKPFRASDVLSYLYVGLLIVFGWGGVLRGLGAVYSTGWKKIPHRRIWEPLMYVHL